MKLIDFFFLDFFNFFFFFLKLMCSCLLTDQMFRIISFNMGNFASVGNFKSGKCSNYMHMHIVKLRFMWKLNSEALTRYFLEEVMINASGLLILIILNWPQNKKLCNIGNRNHYHVKDRINFNESSYFCSKCSIC